MTIQELKQVIVDEVAAIVRAYDNFQKHLQECIDVNRSHLPSVV